MPLLRTHAVAGAMLVLTSGAVAAIERTPPQYITSPETAAGQVQCMETSADLNALGAQSTTEIRRARGLANVRPNAKLADAAARHACDMARRGQMTHHGSTTKGPMQRVKAVGYRPRLTAENIAAGRFGANGVLAAWEASRGHLDNILIPQVQDMGIGRAIGADGKTEFWAAVYGAPRRR